MKKIYRKNFLVLFILIFLSIWITGCAAAINTSNTAKISYYFSQPDHKTDLQLIKVIDGAAKSLDIAVYSITKKEIVNAILNAKTKGVDIRLITDSKEAKNKFQKKALLSLKKAGIPIKINDHQGLMHLKITIADNDIVTTGSYNYSAGATYNNDEVLVVINDQKIASDFEDKFVDMWNDNRKFTDF